MRTLLLTFCLAAAAAAASTDYVVLSGVGEDDPFYEAATRIARFHKTKEIFLFDPMAPVGVLEALRNADPTHVAVVVRPEQIHVNSVRRILKMATMLDNDPFVDFEFGYITGSTAEDAVRFVKNIVRARKGEHPLHLGEVGVFGDEGGCEIKDIPTIVGELNFPTKCLHFRPPGGKGDRDMEFIEKNLGLLSGRGAILLGGHGDPCEIAHGPRAEDMARVDLFPAVAFNYACCTGVTGKFTNDFPENESADSLVVQRMADVGTRQSFALAMIRAGAVGYVAYVNNRPGGPELVIDYHRVLAGSTLGASRRNDYNKITLGYLGIGEPGIVAGDVFEGRKIRQDGPEARIRSALADMTGGILFGDPSFRPFPRNEKQLPLETKVKRSGNELRITSRMLPFYVGMWCMDHFRKTPSGEFVNKLASRVAFPSKMGAVRSVEILSAKRGEADLTTLPVVWAEEIDRGQRYLHVKANFADGGNGLVEIVFLAHFTKPSRR